MQSSVDTGGSCSRTPVPPPGLAQKSPGLGEGEVLLLWRPGGCSTQARPAEMTEQRPPIRAYH